MADPALDYEQAIIEEVQESMFLTQSQSESRHGSPSDQKKSARTATTEAEDSSSERSRLLGDAPKRPSHGRASASYLKAVNEPWNGAYGQGDLPWYKKPSIYWLFPAFLPSCIAIGAVMVPKTYLTIDLICRQYFADKAALDPSFHIFPVILGQDNPQCSAPEVSRLVSYFNTYSNLLSGIPSAIVAPYFGSLSDRIGRKKVMMTISVATMLSEAVTILVGKYPDTISVYWMLFGSLIDGLCGSFTTGLAISMAYAADCSPPAKRAVAFGRFHGVFFFGFAIGPLLGGYLTTVTHSLLVPFYFAIACHVFYILFVTLIVPESLSEERQVIAREKYAKEMAEVADESWAQKIRKYNIFEPLWTLWPTGPGSSTALRRNLTILATIDTLMFGVAMGTLTVLIVYTKATFGWTPMDSSYFMSTTSISRVTGLFLILPLLTKFGRGTIQNFSNSHRGSDRLDLNIIRGSIFLDLLGYLGYALAPTGSVMFLSGIVASLGGMGPPTISSAMTKSIPTHMTGQILGASGLLHALSRVVAPTIFNLIFAATVGFYGGFVFLCLASVWAFVFVLSWIVKPNVYLHDEHSDEHTAQDGTTLMVEDHASSG